MAGVIDCTGLKPVLNSEELLMTLPRIISSCDKCYFSWVSTSFLPGGCSTQSLSLFSSASGTELLLWQKQVYHFHTHPSTRICSDNDDGFTYQQLELQYARNLLRWSSHYDTFA